MDAKRTLPLSELISTLVKNGIDASRPEIKAELEAVAIGEMVDMDVLLAHPESICCKAMTGNLAMKDWSGFTSTMRRIFEDIKKEVHGGNPADYIPILAEANRDWFAASICTVDGQQWSVGDLDIPFSIQSCTKPIMYAVAVEDRGLSYVHRNGPGFEPSGLSFNEVSLNPKGQPHNPYINSGAIATGALIGPGLDAAARFRHFMSRLQEMAGGHKIGFSHATYLCEHETAWRNNALVAFMQDAGVFPKSVDPLEALDFYLQACSIEVNTSSAATIAATLANGGVCPLNGRRALNPTTVKSTISLMFSCGMYDYSGTWMSTVGLPAKSGVAGLIYVVIPHVMGLAVFSPPLDSHGNSVRGVEFCKRLLQAYPFGIFDQIVRGARFASMGALSSGGGAAAGGAGAGATSPAAGAKGRKRGGSVGGDGTTVTASGSGAEASLEDFTGYGGASVMSAGGGAIGGGSGSHKRSSRASVMHRGKSAADVMRGSGAGAKGSGSSGMDDDSFTGAARLDNWRRVFKDLARLHRTLRRLRVWCGLPVTAEDLARLVHAATGEDAGAEPLPELMALAAASGHGAAAAAAPVSARGGARKGAAAGGAAAATAPAVPEDRDAGHGAMWLSDAQVQLEHYREYRASLMPAGRDTFSVDDSVSAAAAAASSAGVASEAETSVAALAAALAPSSSLPLGALRRFIEQQGISTASDNPHMHALWKQVLARHSSKSSPSAAKASAGGAGAVPVPAADGITVRDIILPGAVRSGNVLLRTLLGSLAMPNFRGFVEDMMGLYESVKRKVRDGTPCTKLAIEELSSADPEAFGVAVCTVDGQMLNIGDTDIEFPLMGAVRPLIYALACADNGVAEVERWVGVEPTAAAADTFSLMPAGGGGHGGGGDEDHKKPHPIPDDGHFHPEPERAPHPRPFNPFLDSGALATAALLGRAHYPPEGRLFHDNGSRFSHMVDNFKKLAGGRRVGFNNSVFLAQKQKRLKTVAISFFAKGMGVYPAAADPTETAHMLFQAEAIATNAENLAVIAATLANIGVCPLTQERCLSPDVMKSLLSLMYNSGLCRYTGNWMFQVGIPSAAGVSGAHLVVIPGVAGMVIYSPRLNEFDVPTRAIKFCELLTSRYRVNVFDQLVYADMDVAIGAEQRGSSKAINMEQSLMQYELCTASGAGDAVKVRALLEDGADANVADYDGRCALHIACSDGHMAVVQLLVEAGADVLVRDRWGSSPFDDARRRGHSGIVGYLSDVLSMAGISIPPLPSTTATAATTAFMGHTGGPLHRGGSIGSRASGGAMGGAGSMSADGDSEDGSSDVGSGSGRGGPSPHGLGLGRASSFADAAAALAGATSGPVSARSAGGRATLMSKGGIMSPPPPPKRVTVAAPGSGVGISVTPGPGSATSSRR